MNNNVLRICKNKKIIIIGHKSLRDVGFVYAKFY